MEAIIIVVINLFINKITQEDKVIFKIANNQMGIIMSVIC